MVPLPRDTTDVVLVEDDKDIQDLVVEILHDENISVELCPLGWQAQRWIRELQPRLVILDVQMPDVDGIRLFYLLRADARTSTIPVFFLTANPKIVRDQLPNYEQMEARLIEKPFKVEQLVTEVRAALGR
jgi:DNA-binding response OmpR family regulator